MSVPPQKWLAAGCPARTLPLKQFVRICTAVACVGLLALATALLWQARTRALNTAEATATNLVGMLSQHTERTIDSVDMLLKITARELGPRATDPIKRSNLLANLSQLTQDLPHVMAIRLLDPYSKQPLFEFYRSKSVSRNADQEALQEHAENRSRGLFIGRPYFDDNGKTWVAGISRRISGQEGIPGRVVIALIDLEYINSFHRSIEMGEDGSINVVRSDGIIVTRRPFHASYVGKDISKPLNAAVRGRTSGTYTMTAVTDNISRIYAFRELSRMPLIVTVGVSRNAVLAKWREEVRRGMVLTCIAVLILLAAGELLARAAGHRDRIEAEMRYAASHDALTGLVNRSDLQHSLDALLSGKAGRQLSLLLIDLDEFKTINDTLGHDAGDMLLKEAAARLKRVGADHVARLGGDEFAVVVEGPLPAGIRTANLILEEFRRPFDYLGKTILTSGSVGVTISPEHGMTTSDLLKSADIALYAAKAAGRNRYAIFESGMRAEILARSALHEDIRRGLKEEQFIPYYQPQVCVGTGKVLGFEALARWVHPECGLLTPSKFGSAFENHELAMEVGRILFRKILADMQAWREMGFSFGRVAVNASASELEHPGFSNEILHHMRSAGIQPHMIEIEVTESVLFGKTIDRVHANLLHLHRSGIRIALDDFGTGYASLTHLKRFPIDVLKIDRSFVHNVESDPADASIVTAVIDMARGLNIAVVAEGVETQDHLTFLQRAGCSTAQGFLFAKPMPGSRVPAYLRNLEPSAFPETYEARA